jgi:hypothetical protein
VAAVGRQSRQDIDRLGLRIDQRVTVRGPAGVLHGILVREYDIRAGNALIYFPEANVLLPTTTDAASKTPAFKGVLITVEPEVTTNGAGGVATDGRVSLAVVSRS